MGPLHVNTVGSSGAGSRLLVLLHGFGADENDLAPLVPYLDPEGAYFSICPRAPYDVMGGGAGWYERDGEGTIVGSTFLSSIDAIDDVIDTNCAAHQLARNETVVIGFSQGCAMTMATTLRTDARERPAAIACLSGSMQDVAGHSYDFAADDLPRILVQHGTLDAVVPIERGRRTRARLIEHQVAHDYLEFEMHHEISMESIRSLQSWLATSP